MTDAIWTRANLVNLMTAVSKSNLDITEQELFGKIADTMIQHITAPAQTPPPPPAAVEPAQGEKEQIAAQVLLSMSDKADADLYGVSYALKLNKARAERAADSILSLRTPAEKDNLTEADLRQVIANRDALLADYQEVLTDKQRLTRELDIALHGEEGAAKQASLCDLIQPARQLRANIDLLERNAGIQAKLLADTGRERDQALSQVEKLTTLVRSAYNEGFSEGMREHTTSNGGKPWQWSKTRGVLNTL
jgi:hypothetical protein